jgi:sialate O-acetylesterase
MLMNTKRFALVPYVLCVLYGLPSHCVQAELKLPALFSDNMVLQQGQPVPVWGWADDGEKITVTIGGHKATTIARDGKFCAVLHSLKAGGPEVLSVTAQGRVSGAAGRTLRFSNVLVGEVWICSGQSNMEWPLNRSFESEVDVASATNSQIRLFKVPKNRVECPTVLVDSRWETLSPESTASFSAVGYYFGRELQKARNVPVGLIGTYWGGTPAEAWTSRPALEVNERYKAEILGRQTEWHKQMADFDKRKAEALKAGKEFNDKPPFQPWASELYNGMIAPLLPYGIKGAIWYQGESNAGQAEQYRTLFPDMIRCWRRSWGEPDFTFLCVQLAPFKAIKTEPGESDWAELRDAQLLATKVLPRTGMAVITDVGDEKDIHPKKKAPVGARLALAARGIAYGEKIEYSGPIYRNMMIHGDKVTLWFDHLDHGLLANPGLLKGFAICGSDRKWVWARARIQDDNTIVASAPEVPNPVAVRYGWADYPTGNLWNKDGLPASPFRTDDFPLTTAR